MSLSKQRLRRPAAWNSGKAVGRSPCGYLTRGADEEQGVPRTETRRASLLTETALLSILSASVCEAPSCNGGGFPFWAPKGSCDCESTLGAPKLLYEVQVQQRNFFAAPRAVLNVQFQSKKRLEGRVRRMVPAMLDLFFSMPEHGME